MTKMTPKKVTGKDFPTVKELTEHLAGTSFDDADLQPLRPSLAAIKDAQVIWDPDKLTELMNGVFQPLNPEFVSHRSDDLSLLEAMNPDDAVFLGHFEAEVETVSNDWTAMTDFYVCGVPDTDSTYLLYSLDWNDNWSRWERIANCAVTGVRNIQIAIAVLKESFAKSQLALAQDEWHEFLSGWLTSSNDKRSSD